MLPKFLLFSYIASFERRSKAVAAFQQKKTKLDFSDA